MSFIFDQIRIHQENAAFSLGYLMLLWPWKTRYKSFLFYIYKQSKHWELIISQRLKGCVWLLFRKYIKMSRPAFKQLHSDSRCWFCSVTLITKAKDKPRLAKWAHQNISATQQINYVDHLYLKDCQSSGSAPIIIIHRFPIFHTNLQQQKRANMVLLYTTHEKWERAPNHTHKVAVTTRSQTTEPVAVL